MTVDEVATRLGWSASKVYRLESGAVGVSITDLRALLDLYGGDPALLTRLQVPVRQGRVRHWAAAYRSVLTTGYLDLLGYEAEAITLDVYDPVRVPALLCTPDYAAAGLHPGAARRGLSPAGRAGLQTERRRRLFDRPVAIRAMLDETALGRRIGGRLVLTEQLHDLIELAGRPGTQLRLLPADRQTTLPPPALSIMTVPQGPPLAYLDHGAPTAYPVGADHVPDMQHEFDTWWDRSLSPTETVARLAARSREPAQG